jgi:hypothetical protein
MQRALLNIDMRGRVGYGQTPLPHQLHGLVFEFRRERSSFFIACLLNHFHLKLDANKTWGIPAGNEAPALPPD